MSNSNSKRKRNSNNRGVGRAVLDEAELADHYESGHMFGYWSELPWDLGRTPARRYTTARGAFRRGIYDGVKLRQQHRRRAKEILADPRRMVGDSETLQLLNNELSRSAATSALSEPALSPDQRALRAAEMLVKAGAVTRKELGL